MNEYEAIADVQQIVTCKLYKEVGAPPHFHRSIELVYVVKGRIEAKTGSLNQSVSENEILFVPSCFMHTMFSVPGTRSFTFIIPYNYFSSFEKDGYKFCYTALRDRVFNRLILDLIKMAKKDISLQPSLLMQGYINVILGNILSHYPCCEIEEKQNKLMISVIEYIEKRYTENISLDELANAFGYSRYYFSRLFNKFFDCNLKRFVNRLREGSLYSEDNDAKNKTDKILNAGFSSLSTFYKYKNSDNQ